MSEDDIQRIADLSEKAENYAHAAKLPLPDHLHVEQLTIGMKALRDELREIYIRTTGNNPWV
jgi:hypothetical protein